MPASTPKQARFMRAVEHNPSFAAKVGVPQEVGREFSKPPGPPKPPAPPSAPMPPENAQRLAQALRFDAKKGLA